MGIGPATAQCDALTLTRHSAGLPRMCSLRAAGFPGARGAIPLRWLLAHMKTQTHSSLVALPNGRPSRKVANNTLAVRLESGAVALRLHQTDILTAEPSGAVVINSGGWRTSTTKARLNEYLRDGLSISQSRGVWHWSRTLAQPSSDGMHRESLGVFSDGDRLTRTGRLILKARPDAEDKARKLTREVNRFAKLCADSLPIEQPGAGDCFYCGLVVQDEKPAPLGAAHHYNGNPPVCRKSLGDATGIVSHLIEHMREGYVVPSLVMSALRERGETDLILAGAFGQAPFALPIARRYVKAAVARYLKRRLSLAS
jgi:hypothetical protein